MRPVKIYLWLKELIIDRRKVVNLEESSGDILLLCYVDNELDADQRAAVEKLLAHDPAARQKVAQIRRLNMLLKAAYSDDGERK
jgi:anti-sigma factor RsiW